MQALAPKDANVFAGCYVARPYNFNINPVPFLKERYIERLWSYQSGGRPTA